MSIYIESPKQRRNTEERFSSVLDMLLKCSFLIIVISAVNLITYYYSFNIQIIDYLEMTEITSLFLNQLPNYLLLLIPVILFLFRGGFMFRCLLSITLFLTHLITADTNIHTKGQFLVIFSVLYLPAFVVFITHKAKGDTLFFHRNQERKWKLIAYIFASSIFATCLNSKCSAILVKSRSLYYGTEMILDGKKIISDSTFYYVGQTKNYIFCYDDKKRRPRIYRADKLQEISINTIDLEMFFNMTEEECRRHLLRHGLPVPNPADFQ